jgi:hypothetical protein
MKSVFRQRQRAIIIRLEDTSSPKLLIRAIGERDDHATLVDPPSFQSAPRRRRAQR